MHKYHATVDATYVKNTTITVDAENDTEAFRKIQTAAHEQFDEADTVDIGDVIAGSGTEGEIENLDPDAILEDDDIIIIRGSSDEAQPEINSDYCNACC